MATSTPCIRLYGVLATPQEEVVASVFLVVYARSRMLFTKISIFGIKLALGPREPPRLLDPEGFATVALSRHPLPPYVAVST